MSTNSSDIDIHSPRVVKSDKQPVSRWFLLGLPLWVLFGFIAANIFVVALLYGLRAVGVSTAGINQTIFSTVVAVAVYVFSLAIVIGLPWQLQKRRTTRTEMGMKKPVHWLDILLAPAGFVVYTVTTALLIYLATQFIPSFNVSQAQEIGFRDLTEQYQLVLAFITLVVLAPVAEEALFRGYLFGKLRRLSPFWVSTIIASVLFAALHLPGDGALQWNVAIDVFALSLVLCSLREITGSIWAGVLLHMFKNGLAFYVLFIDPTFFGILGG